MGRWCCKRTGVLYLPALRLLRLYMYHENVYLEWCIQGMVLYYLWSWCKFFILPLLSKNIHTFLNLSLSYFYYILLFVLHFPDFSFRIQSFHWSKLKSIVMGHGLSQDLLQSQFLWSSSSTYTLLTRNTKSMAPEKNIISIPPTEDSFICTPPPPQGFSIPGGSLMTLLPWGISRIAVDREFLPPSEIQSGFWKWILHVTQLRKYNRILLQQCKH